MTGFSVETVASDIWISAVILELQKQPLEMFYEKGVLKNFAKFTGKHLCQSLFFNKVEGLRPAALQLY